jgi:antitoxin VapB
MATARVFMSGNSQAVRLPKEFRFTASDVEILRRGNEVVLRERAQGLSRAFDLLAAMPGDFFSKARLDPPPQQRTGL